MFFSDCLGQDSLKKKLTDSIHAGRIPHAQMFSGPDGSGSLAMAIAYAQFVACIGEKQADSCGQCASCRKFAILAHPDLHFSFPVNSTKSVKDPSSDDFLSKWRELILSDPYFRPNEWYNHIGLENKQGLITKKEGKRIARKLSLKSFESEYKFMIIWLPEKMHASASNQLLKLIEEPPPKTVFLLVSEEPGNVMLTISSRTQPVKLDRINDEALFHIIANRYNKTAEETNFLVHLANGSYIKAKELINISEENAYHFKQFTTIMRLCWERKYQEINQWVNDMSTIGRERLKTFFEYAIRLLRENFVSNLSESKLVYLSPEEEKFSSRFHPFVNGRNIVKLYEEFGRAASDIERNGYAKLILFDMSLQIVKLIRQ